MEVQRCQEELVCIFFLFAHSRQFLFIFNNACGSFILFLNPLQHRRKSVAETKIHDIVTLWAELGITAESDFDLEILCHHRLTRGEDSRNLRLSDEEGEGRLLLTQENLYKLEMKKNEVTLFVYAPSTKMFVNVLNRFANIFETFISWKSASLVIS